MTSPRILFATVLLHCCLYQGVAPTLEAQQRNPKKKFVNFRDPARQYESLRIGEFKFTVEKQLLQQSPGLAKRSATRLAKNIDSALAILPDQAKPILKEIPFFLMYGSKAKGGGRDSGLAYFQKQAPKNRPELDKNWGSSIVVYSADNYSRLKDFWALKAVVHELAHAYQLEQWPEKQPDILNAWKHAMDLGLHHKVRDDKNKLLAKSYASVNQLEYFAELSCMYFVGCNYQPFDRRELELYDSQGFEMVKKMWYTKPERKPMKARNKRRADR
jgi:hypothetical protein